MTATTDTAQGAANTLFDILTVDGPTLLDDAIDRVVRELECSRQEALYGLTRARRDKLVSIVPGTRLLVATSQTLTVDGHLLNLGHAVSPDPALSFDPAPSPLRYDQLLAYGEAVGRHHDAYDSNGRADLDALIDVLGGRVERQADGGIQLLVFGAGDFIVNPAEFESNRRKRRRIAWALGSYFVHYLQPGLRGGRVLRHHHDERASWQARLFAAGLLMPAAEFTDAWIRLTCDTWAVGEQFSVAPETVRDRATVLGLRTDDDADGWVPRMTEL